MVRVHFINGIWRLVIIAPLLWFAAMSLSALGAPTNSKLLSIADRGNVVGLDTNAGTSLVAVLESPRGGHANPPYVLRVYQTATQKEIFSLPVDASVESRQKVVKLSPDGRFVAVRDAHYVNVWDINSKRNIARIGGKAAADFCWTPDSKSILAIVGYDPVLEAYSATGTKLASFVATGYNRNANVFASATMVAVSNDARDKTNQQVVITWDSKGRKLATRSVRGRLIGFSKGGGLASVERVTDATSVYRETNRPANDMRLDASSPNGAIKVVTISPNGGLLAVSDYGGALKIIDLANRTILVTYRARQDLDQRANKISGILADHVAGKSQEEKAVAAMLATAMTDNLRSKHQPNTADFLNWTPDGRSLVYLDAGAKLESGIVLKVSF
jgi:WD40 repeat protein